MVKKSISIKNDNLKLLGICGSTTEHARALIAVEKTLEFAKQWSQNIIVEAINIRDHDIPFCDSRDPQLYEGDAKVIISKIAECHGLIIGSPVYRGSYTGILKNLFDIIPNNSLQGKPVGIIATGNTDHHYLMIENNLKPLLGFFHMHIIPGAVFINHKDFVDNQLVDQGVLARLNELSKAVTNFAVHLPPELHNLVGPPGPDIKWSTKPKMKIVKT